MAEMWWRHSTYLALNFYFSLGSISTCLDIMHKTRKRGDYCLAYLFDFSAKNARRFRESGGKQEAVSTVIIWNGQSLDIWDFWHWRQTKSRHTSQPNVGYFQDSVQEIRAKSEWRWRRRSQAKESVLSIAIQEKDEEKVKKNVLWFLLVRTGRDHCCAGDSLQHFLRKHRKWGSMRRPRILAFRWSANWVLWWMTFKNRLSLVQPPPPQRLPDHMSQHSVCVCVSSGECKGYTTAL